MASNTSRSCPGPVAVPRSSSPTRQRCVISATRWCSTSLAFSRSKTRGGNAMRSRMLHTLRLLFVAGTALTAPLALAADVTPERLLNADKEPQNWLMNHRTYDGQRFSPLDRINKSNVKGLKLAYAVPLGGGAGNEYSVATPLAEDGFLYVTDSWGVLYKIDGTSGTVGRIVWRMDPKQAKQQRNRGAALWGNLVITAADGPPRIIATNKDSGKVEWESAFADTPDAP